MDTIILAGSQHCGIVMKIEKSLDPYLRFSNCTLAQLCSPCKWAYDVRSDESNRYTCQWKAGRRSYSGRAQANLKAHRPHQDHELHGNKKIIEQLKAGEDVLQLTEWGIVNAVIQFAVSSDFSEKQCHCGNADPGKRGHRIFDLSLNLILNRRRQKCIWWGAQWCFIKGRIHCITR